MSHYLLTQSANFDLSVRAEDLRQKFNFQFKVEK